MAPPSVELHSELTKMFLSGVFVSLIFLVGFYYIPVQLVGTSTGRATQLLCDFRSLPSSPVNGTTILRVMKDGENVSLVFDNTRFSSSLVGGTLKCANVEFLAVSKTAITGMVVVTGDVIPVLTSAGESRQVFFVESIRASQHYDDFISNNRSLVSGIVLMMVWLGSAIFFVSIVKILANIPGEEGEVVEAATKGYKTQMHEDET
jgi:hypothetical protein